MSFKVRLRLKLNVKTEISLCMAIMLDHPWQSLYTQYYCLIHVPVVQINTPHFQYKRVTLRSEGGREGRRGGGREGERREGERREGERREGEVEGRREGGREGGRKEGERERERGGGVKEEGSGDTTVFKTSIAPVTSAVSTSISTHTGRPGSGILPSSDLFSSLETCLSSTIDRLNW